MSNPTPTHDPEASASLQRLQTAVVAWAEETFGIERDIRLAIQHLRNETRELERAPDSAEELADCLILLLHIAAHAGLDVDALTEAGWHKHYVNTGRDWPARRGHHGRQRGQDWAQEQDAIIEHARTPEDLQRSAAALTEEELSALMLGAARAVRYYHDQDGADPETAPLVPHAMLQALERWAMAAKLDQAVLRLVQDERAYMIVRDTDQPLPNPDIYFVPHGASHPVGDVFIEYDPSAPPTLVRLTGASAARVLAGQPEDPAR